MKKNIVIGVLIVIILIMGGSLFYLNTSKDKIRNNHNTQKTEPSKKEEVIEEEKSQETATDGNVKLLKGKYKYNEKRGTAATGTELDLNIELEIINDTEMTITSDDTLSEIETTKGTYSINGNILTYERVYVKDVNNEWKKCSDIDNNETDCYSYKVLKRESFIIDMANKTLYETNYNVYGNVGYGPITLKYQE